MRAFGGVALLLAFITLYANSKSQNTQSSNAPGLVYEIKDMGAVDALILLGELYDQPLGIICRDTEIASRKITLTMTAGSAEEVLRSLIGQLPGYQWRKENGVLIVRPAVLPEQTAKMLRIVIPRISADNIDVDTLSDRL